MKTMRCPDCDASGFETNHKGNMILVRADHTYEKCQERNLHHESYDRGLCADVDHHYVVCRRCGGTGRISSPEYLLGQVLKLLKPENIRKEKVNA